MKKLQIILAIIAAVPALLILTWLVAIPEELIEGHIENAMAQSGNNMSLSVDGLRKGILFALYADSLDLQMDNKPAIQITNFSSSFSPSYLSNKQLAFAISGNIGTGDLKGIVKLPVEGDITIDKAELSAISYLNRFGISIRGNLSSSIKIINETSVNVVFEIPDLDIAESALAAVPFLNTFHKMQGAISIAGNRIQFDSVSLEGEKGYARVKGNISNGVMNLELEVMPLADSLNTLESMVIGKYIVSPGYYVIPITGPLM